MARVYILGKQVIFDVLKRQICSGEYVVSIGGREAAILSMLCEQENIVVSKDDIQEKVWGNVCVSETSLTKAISNLRKSLQQFNDLYCEIKTIPKEGYSLVFDEGSGGSYRANEPIPLEVTKVETSKKEPLRIGFKTEEQEKRKLEYPVKFSVSTDVGMVVICISITIIISFLTSAVYILLDSMLSK
ncbi:transcriptional regulator [Shewanella waksmanii]|uniref:winged helix-turn-helix domain-containing protein n=1 Tax=Shewanella waksmanii TaxID=213783 RepID=UPI003734EFF2